MIFFFHKEIWHLSNKVEEAVFLVIVLIKITFLLRKGDI